MAWRWRDMLLPALLAVPAACGPVRAEQAPHAIQTPQQAAAAVAAGDYAEAFCFWKARAQQGDADAQFHLGWMYHNGYGLRLNDETAARWWQQAALQGHAEATLALGNLYRLGGRHVSRNRNRAIDYLLHAARAGAADAGQLLRAILAENHSSIRDRIPELVERYAVLIGGAREVQAERANLRKGAGTRHAVIQTLSRGEAVIELKREGRWVHLLLRRDGSRGWMHDSLLRNPARG